MRILLLMVLFAGCGGETSTSQDDSTAMDKERDLEQLLAGSGSRSNDDPDVRRIVVLADGAVVEESADAGSAMFTSEIDASEPEVDAGEMPAAGSGSLPPLVDAGALEDASVIEESTAFQSCDQAASHCGEEELCIQISGGATYCSPRQCKTVPAGECPVLFGEPTMCASAGCIIRCEADSECPSGMHCYDPKIGAPFPDLVFDPKRCLFEE